MVAVVCSGAGHSMVPGSCAPVGCALPADHGWPGAGLLAGTVVRQGWQAQDRGSGGSQQVLVVQGASMSDLAGKEAGASLRPGFPAMPTPQPA